MRTLVRALDPAEPDPAALAEAAALLRAGRLVAFPTETVYGLGANALDAAAVGSVFRAKGRPSRNPLIVHVAEVSDVSGVAADFPSAARRLADQFWPGPLTLVLPRGASLPSAVTAGGPSVAVRVPAHPVARALIRTAGVPVAAPSANRSGQLSPTRAEHVLASLDGLIDMVLDAGPCPGGVESTVVDLTGERARLLRPGLVTPAQIETVVGPLERGVPADAGGKALPSPGMLTRHYAPRTPLTLFEAGDDVPGGPGVGRLVLPADPSAAAAELYDALHRLDAAGLERIVAVLPPTSDEWLAVRDRLRRAAASE